MISRFFIDRPIFASVLSIVVTLAGAIALFTLPIAMYPPISPPTVQVDCSYPGASAQVVAETVATPIEQQVNGVENMLYMSSQCTNDGAYNLTVTFRHGVNLNMAQVLVQNRVSLAIPLLPDVIKQTGVTTRKKSPDILLAMAVNSDFRTAHDPNGAQLFNPDGTPRLLQAVGSDGKPIFNSDGSPKFQPLYDQLFLSNYALLHLKDEIARLPGVSDIGMLGQRDYSMRIWVDPEKLAARDMMASDVATAIRRENAQVATGQIGQPPTPSGQEFQVPLSTLGRLVEPTQFENIIIKKSTDGRIVRIGDVARVEMGPKNQDINCSVNGKPSVSLAIFQLPDANALDTADLIKAKIAELAEDFPPGLHYEIRYDTTPFIRESIGEVVKTLRDAVILVAAVVLLFLQNWRSALIPLVAVPVAIVGTFAVMAALGFSLNNLTLFGLVLAIGIVVDDAIVVVEAVEHHVERGMEPRAATIRAMDEVSGPVIAIGLVLTAVFVPCAFISGIVGQFFRQFALTIATSTVISAFNSLTLSPALAAILIKPRTGKKAEALPRAFYIALGTWAGYAILTPILAARVRTTYPDALPYLSALIGAACGWVAGSQKKVGWPVRLIFAAAGGWIGVVMVGPWLAGSAGGLGSWLARDVPWIASRVPAVVSALSPANAIRIGVIGGPILGVLGGLLLSWPLDGALVEFFGAFNAGFRLATAGYTRTVSIFLRASLAALLLYVGLLYLTYDQFKKTPSGFIPTQDMGYLLANVQLPDSASLERTRVVMDQCERIARSTPGIKHTQAMTGQSLLLSANGSNFGSMFCILDKFEERKTRDLYSEAVIATLRKKFVEQVPDAVITVLGPPPVRGVGRAGGFKLMVEDRGDTKSNSLRGRAENTSNSPPGQADRKPKAPAGQPDRASNTLQGQTDNLVARAREFVDPDTGQQKLTSLVSTFRANVPQYFVNVNRAECMTKEVALKDLFDTLRIYLGSLYVNDFNRFGRTWQVVVQADNRFRNAVETVPRLKVRNARGMMVPIGTVADLRRDNGPLVLTRYNTYPAAPVNGAAAPGVSSGDAIATMQMLGDAYLLKSMKTEWTELAFLELQAGNTAIILFGVAVVMVFLVLAAQYESWSMPLAIILVVPLCLLSAVVGVNIAGEDINIFTQIGFVVLVGLASKNAILSVEFAKQRRDAGESRRQATMEACALRLRPIIMTSFAFILGVLPLLTGHGAWAEMRRTLGTTDFSGMLGVTMFGIFLTPEFFFAIDWLGETRLFASPGLRRIAGIPLRALSVVLLFRPARRRFGRGATKPEPSHELEPDPSTVAVADREGESEARN